MKTEKEILEMLEHVESDKLTFNEETSIKGSIIVFLRWVLQTTPLKRTIFDLTEEELRELYEIAIGNDEIESLGYKVSHTNITTYPRFIRYTISYKQKKNEKPFYELYIYNNLDFYLNYDGYGVKVNNQVKLMERLNEMLSEEVK